MTGIENLKKLKMEANRAKYPNCPEKALPKPKYSDRTANGLTRCIIDFITLKGYQAERVSNTGRRIDNRETVKDAIGRTRTVGSVKFIKGSGRKGTADISATIAGRAVKIEVKIGKDKLSRHQKAYKAEVEAAGGLYFVARSFEQFHEWYKETFEKENPDWKGPGQTSK